MNNPIHLSGSTRLFATIGHPVRQVRAPELLSAVFANSGIDAVWLPLELEAADLRLALDMLRGVRNLGGLSVTIPYKAAMLELVDRATARARLAGGVNLVRRQADGVLLGDMVDGAGFVGGLRAAGYALAGKRAWICGAGGAGNAIAAALCEAGVGAVLLSDTDRERVAATCRRLDVAYPGIAAAATEPPTTVDFAINATPCGLRPEDGMPFDPETVGPSAVVCDVIMKPAVTKLLARAGEAGMRVHAGRAMLDHQVPEYLRFFGLPHDHDGVMAFVRDFAAGDVSAAA